MNAIKLVSGVVLLFSAVGCGGTSESPAEACNKQYETECTRIYECYTPAAIAALGLPASESACVTMEEAAQGCSAKTEANFCVAGNAVYHGEAVDGCIAQLNGATCAEIMSSMDITVIA